MYLIAAELSVANPLLKKLSFMDGSSDLNLGDKQHLFASPATLCPSERFSDINVFC